MTGRAKNSRVLCPPESTRVVRASFNDGFPRLLSPGSDPGMHGPVSAVTELRGHRRISCTRREGVRRRACLRRLSQRVRTWGLTNRRGRPLRSQAIGVLLRNQLYAGIVDVPEYGVRGKGGDFEPLISEELFYRVQAILSGRVASTAPRQRAHPDFSLRGFATVAHAEASS